MDTIIICFLVFSIYLMHRSCAGDSNVVKPSCPESHASCHFNFTVERRLTRTLLLLPEHQEHAVAHFYDNGNAYYINISRPCHVVNMRDQDVPLVVAADGFPRPVTLVNGRLPGPPVVVYEGQEVVVTVTNAMYNEAMTLHWHGIHQRASPWMDGVGSVSQCGILPGETFTYRFAASPVGTHWYHAHLGIQRAEGAYGPLVVLPRTRQPPQQSSTERQREDNESPITTEFHMMVQDWFASTSFIVQKQWELNIPHFGDNYASTNCTFHGTYTPDKEQHSFVKPKSILINGKGHHFPDNGDIPEHPGIPLEVYHVVNGGRFLFRVTSSSLAHTLMISVDGHDLHVTATEGQQVDPLVVESLIIGPGERYDFWIDGTDPDGIHNYWIRVEGIDIYTGYAEGTLLKMERRRSFHAESILSYTQDKTNKPTSQRRKCSTKSPCKTLNCPYKYYPIADYRVCIPITSLTSKSHESHTGAAHNEDKDHQPIVEKFLSFQYIIGPLPYETFTSSVNSIQHVPPTSPPMVTPGGLSDEDICDRCPEGESWCRCTHVIKLPLNRTVYFTVFSNMHPIHLHGHSFEIVKIGYPTYDPITGVKLIDNSDITCSDKYCQRSWWTNSSWSGGNLPDMMSCGIHKDTFLVPAGGYVVVRFVTDNPGFWLMHCHMQMHNADGMALIVQEGEARDMPAPPSNMKQCGNFHWTEQEYRNKLKQATVPHAAVAVNRIIAADNSETHRFPMALIITMMTLTGVIVICALVIYKRSTATKRNHYIKY